MALIQLGGLVTGIRNSIKGSTYSQNKGGAYVKGKPIPTNPRTPAQRLVRANFAANAKLWSGTLTAAQRAAWTFFAANNPYTNVFGEVKQLSGMAMMMSLNQVLAQVGVAPIEDAPADLSVPALATITFLSSPIDAGTPATDVTLNTDAQAVVAGARYYLFATPPLAGGRAAGVSDYRFIGILPAVAAAVQLTLDALYAVVFPGPAVTGQHIAVLAATVNMATGAVTPALGFDSRVA